jgi:uncharacterized protein YraI
MMSPTWSPKNTIYNFGYGSTYHYWYKGSTYKGMAYSQNNPQENWAEFKSRVDSTSGGTTGYGNDCSGFVSMAWKLPSRYTTWTFENDATQSGGYVSSLGAVGSGQNAGLKLGDALNRSSSHIVLFKSRTTSGILAMEQTPWTARQREWSWSQLSKYRPIRRNQISETSTPAPGNGVVTAASLNVRTGPNTGYSIASVLSENASVAVSCKVDGSTHSGSEGTTNQWYRVSGGYVSAAHVRVSSSVAPCTVSGTVVVSQSLNARSGPGSSYGVVDTLSANQSVAIQCYANGTTHTGTQGTTNRWYRIGTGKYASGAYIKPGSGSLFVCTQ